MSLCSVLILPWLGLTPFYTRGEPREAIVAQSIMRDGRWILPAGYGSEVPSKPPFLHWMIAAGSYPVGSVSEASARLPSALAAIAFILYFSIWVGKRRGVTISAIACFILMTSLEWLRASQGCRVDLVHSASLAAGLCALYSYHEKDLKGVPLAAIALLSVATLTKGPVALILSVGVFVLFAIASSISLRRTLLCCLLIFVPVLIITSIWYFLAYQHGGSQFWDMVIDENFRRFTSSMEETPHKHGIAYLVATTFLGFLPWSLLLLAPLIFGSIPKVWRRRVGIVNLMKAQAIKCDSLTRFCLIAAFVIFGFYCIPASKRSVYVLAAYPFLALGASHVIVGLAADSAKFFQYAIAGLLAVFALLVFVLGLALMLPPDLIRSSITTDPTTMFYVTAMQAELSSAIPLILCLFTIFFGLLALRVVRESYSLACLRPAAIALFSLLLLLASTLMPAIGRTVSPLGFSNQVAALVPSDQNLYSFGSEFYATSFYANRPIYSLPPDIPKLAWVVLEVDKIGDFEAVLSKTRKFEILAQSGNGFLKPQHRALLLRVVE